MTIKSTQAKPSPKLEKLQDILADLTDIDPEFPLSWALVFVEIAQNEGAALKDIAEQTGISMSVMSRTVGALSNARRMGKPYGLVTVKMAKDDRRRKELFLSPRGKKLAEALKKKI
jgi:DNA-binding MarR family transcriptional regulator